MPLEYLAIPLHDRGASSPDGRGFFLTLLFLTVKPPQRISYMVYIASQVIMKLKTSNNKYSEPRSVPPLLGFMKLSVNVCGQESARLLSVL